MRQNGKAARRWAREPRRSVAQTSAHVPLVARWGARSAQHASVYTGGACGDGTPLEPLAGVKCVLVPRAMNLARSQAAAAGQLFIPQGGGGRLGEHVAFARGVQESGDEDDKKHSCGCQLRTLESFWCVPGPKTRPIADRRAGVRTHGCGWPLQFLP